MKKIILSDPADGEVLKYQSQMVRQWFLVQYYPVFLPLFDTFCGRYFGFPLTERSHLLPMMRSRRITLLRVEGDMFLASTIFSKDFTVLTIGCCIMIFTEGQLGEI